MFDDLHRSGTTLLTYSISQLTRLLLYGHPNYTLYINRTILRRVNDFILHSDRFSESLLQ